MYLGATEPTVKRRQAIEKRIVLATIDELLAQGFALSVFDGDETTKPSTNRETTIKAIMNTDDDILFVHRAMSNAQMGWIRFVYGNDGYDVMSDYTVNIEQYLPKTMALIAKLDK